MPTVIAIWAVVWALAAAGVALVGIRRGHPRWAADLYELFGIYPHGFPLAPTPADGVRGFGWQTLVAWILIWGVGLAIAAPSVLARSRPAVRTVPAQGSA
jgi:hypothetical protein